ncbi:MAG: redoxin domain-containing protein [Actinomycetota bacterium]|nr:redoxin domain-containing protein [Actinomycetota bacterium]
MSTHRRPAGLLASVAITAALLAGCGSGEASTDTSAAADSTSEASTTQPPPVPGNEGKPDRDPDNDKVAEPTADVPEILDFDATLVSGADFDARGLAGNDTVFWFWAPWCTECAAAAPEVQAAAEAIPDVRFVGVAGLSSDVGAMQTFVDQYGLSFPQLSDADGSVYTRFGITQQDTYVLVSAEGDSETVGSYSSDTDVQQLVNDAFG